MCCSPFVGTIVAGVLGIFQTFVNLCWNVPLIVGLSLNKTEIQTFMPFDNSEIDHPFVIYGVTILLALVNIQLMIFSCLLFKANHDLRTDWIAGWCVLVLSKSIINVLLGIYFLYEYGNDPLQRISNFRLAVLFSGIFFFWPVINVILFGMVFKRYRDIVKDRTSIRQVTIRRESCPPAEDTPPPYTPGPYIYRPPTLDAAQITGWSQQPLLNFDQDEAQQTGNS
ncbi:hypothetical protein JTE90_004214 [Oedothorax gibbosus]|uniref:Uncharacterized protein n=1 Tax=Oedothorax gibbosus TaxID=931172 RepID=A0AAV6V3V5_9ARAC|nr:hypothetical protein JTE90_004214 [Oedothorax gibbosus]